MNVAFQLLIFGSISYLIVAILSAKNKGGYRLRNRINIKNIYAHLHDRSLDERLNMAGWEIKSTTVNAIRYGASLLYLIQNYTLALIRGDQLSMAPIIVTVFLIVATSGASFMPLGLILKKMHERNLRLRDGEWISFLKLYESNRRRKDGYIEFSTFCGQISSYFRFIDKHLLILSELTLNKGLAGALDWLIDQYPADHPFMPYIRSIILATDQVNYETAIGFLNTQNESIARLCNEYYREKWAGLVNIASFVNVMPIIIILFTILLIVMMRLWVISPLIINY